MDSVLACVAEWIPRQRWYTAKASAPQLRVLTGWDLPSEDPTARVRTMLVTDDSSHPAVSYQLPIVLRTAPPVDLSHIIGTTGDGLTLVDGPHDPEYAAALLRRVAPGITSARAEVLTGEQSNTSIIYTAASGPPIICKVFRQIHPGMNPDIELQSVLAASGSRHVPGTVGHLGAQWPDPAEPTRAVTGSLAFAQEFLPGTEDAWRGAVRAAARGESFTAPAHALGVTTAEVHVALAQLLPTVPADDAAREAIAAAWQRRLSIALAEVPGLAPHRDAVEAVYRRAHGAPWPALQRIHGDYHLGQVLQVPGRGWVLLDFEGEPLRPIAERRLPDLAQRDVAGMLRSFDYVAATLRRAPEGAPASAPRWADETRGAFLDGYEHAIGRTVTGGLLDALELDKAVYETIYETRNRPSWLGIPLGAVERLTAHVGLGR
ncbi:maltokinase N-terminal cap-like domain-containing protein [Microbacterium invictum]|uniref:Maltokinase n=1 Tax=Microbacterium invictum TaxID=515415 RepID=A0AA40SM75_9MICO|nr:MULTISPECIES: aminoglycoside phosphotransferase [Microbacterium]MBB4138805.1 putative trehalose synthase [Microbacterium invictum]